MHIVTCPCHEAKQLLMFLLSKFSKFLVNKNCLRVIFVWVAFSSFLGPAGLSTLHKQSRGLSEFSSLWKIVPSRIPTARQFAQCVTLLLTLYTTPQDHTYRRDAGTQATFVLLTISELTHWLSFSLFLSSQYVPFLSHWWTPLCNMTPSFSLFLSHVINLTGTFVFWEFLPWQRVT